MGKAPQQICQIDFWRWQS